ARGTGARAEAKDHDNEKSKPPHDSLDRLPICSRSPSKEGRSTRMSLVGAGGDDVGERRDRVSNLVLRVEEVRPQADSTRGVGPEVAEDPALADLIVAGGG